MWPFARDRNIEPEKWEDLDWAPGKRLSNLTKLFCFVDAQAKSGMVLREEKVEGTVVPLASVLGNHFRRPGNIHAWTGP
jgi:hypothetical protein